MTGQAWEPGDGPTCAFCDRPWAPGHDCAGQREAAIASAVVEPADDLLGIPRFLMSCASEPGGATIEVESEERAGFAAGGTIGAACGICGAPAETGIVADRAAILAEPGTYAAADPDDVRRLTPPSPEVRAERKRIRDLRLEVLDLVERIIASSVDLWREDQMIALALRLETFIGESGDPETRLKLLQRAGYLTKGKLRAGDLESLTGKLELYLARTSAEVPS